MTLSLPALIEISTGVERTLVRRALRVGGRLTGRAISHERYMARCDAIAAAIGREPAAVLFTHLAPENDGAVAFVGGERLVEVQFEVGDDEPASEAA